jgi:hypothetical protein
MLLNNLSNGHLNGVKTQLIIDLLKADSEKRLHKVQRDADCVRSLLLLELCSQ